MIRLCKKVITQRQLVWMKVSKRTDYQPENELQLIPFCQTLWHSLHPVPLVFWIVCTIAGAYWGTKFVFQPREGQVTLHSVSQRDSTWHDQTKFSTNQLHATPAMRCELSAVLTYPKCDRHRDTPNVSAKAWIVRDCIDGTSFYRWERGGTVFHGILLSGKHHPTTCRGSGWYCPQEWLQQCQAQAAASIGNRG